MKKTYLLSILLCCYCSLIEAQNTLVSSGAFFEGEPYLAIDPTDPQTLVAAWMGFQINEKIVIKSARSTDGGLSWSAPIWQAHQQAGNSSADVSMAFDTQGNLYMAYIDYDNVNFSNGAIVCRKSTNAGLSWGAATVARSITSCPNKLCIDRPWIAVDPLTGSIIITSTNAKQPTMVTAPFHPYLAISSDQGATFSLQELDAPPYLAGNAISQPLPSPAFANNGTFMALYPSYDPTQSILPRIVEVSKTAAASFYSYQIAFQGLGFGTTNDSLKIGPHLALDPSNANHAVYTFATEVFGDPDIALIERNNGVWSAPQRVNNDAQANGALQDLAWADFDSDGDYAVCWRDRRNGIANTYSSPTEIVCRIKSQGMWDNEIFISPQVIDDSILLQNGNDFMNIQFEGDKLYTIWGDVRSGALKIYLNVFNQQDSTNQTSLISSQAIVFPNPCNEYIQLPELFANMDFEIFLSNGQMIFKGKSSQDSKIDLTDLQKGSYLLKIGSLSEPFLKN